jgi:hypothetical protein
MSKTIIYTCGKGTTSRELLRSRVANVTAYFPELVPGAALSLPLTEDEQLGLLEDLTGETIITVSETIILMFLREIRLRRMRTHDFELYCNGDRIDVATSGAILDPWPGGFFETGFNLRFN